MKNIRRFFFLSFLAIVFFVQGCRDETPHKSDLSILRYGTSFGFCLGYCQRDLIFIDSEILYVRSSRADTLQDILCQKPLSNSEWDELLNKIDLDSFLDLDPVIGCPDCTDGGSEYVEMEGSNFKYRVTFEYLNEPEAVTPFIPVLRDYILEFEGCSPGP